MLSNVLLLFILGVIISWICTNAFRMFKDFINKSFNDDSDEKSCVIQILYLDDYFYNDSSVSLNNNLSNNYHRLIFATIPLKDIGFCLVDNITYNKLHVGDCYTANFIEGENGKYTLSFDFSKRHDDITPPCCYSNERIKSVPSCIENLEDVEFKRTIGSGIDTDDIFYDGYDEDEVEDDENELEDDEDNKVEYNGTLSFESKTGRNYDINKKTECVTLTSKVNGSIEYSEKDRNQTRVQDIEKVDIELEDNDIHNSSEDITTSDYSYPDTKGIWDNIGS